MRVDGGAVANNFLMQFQADMINAKVIRPKALETTALGAAYLAGLAVGYWSSIDELKALWAKEQVFESKMQSEQRDHYMHYWQKAVARAKDWSE